MGHCDSYYYGECTYGACQEASWVGDGWGNAAEWLGNARRSGFGTTDRPTVGAICVYGSSSAYSVYGHVGMVVAVYGNNSFRIREMNYAGWNQWDERNSSMFDVLGFILPPGVAAGSGGSGQGGGSAGAPAGQGFSDAAGAWGEIQGHVGFWNQTAGGLAPGVGPWPRGGTLLPPGPGVPDIGGAAVGSIAHIKGWALWQMMDPVHKLISQIPFGVGGWLAQRVDGLLWQVWQQISGNVNQEVGNLSSTLRGVGRAIDRVIGALYYSVGDLSGATIWIVTKVIPQNVSYLQQLAASWVYGAEQYAQSLVIGEHNWASSAIYAAMQYAQGLFGQAIAYAQALSRQDQAYAQALAQQEQRYAEQLQAQAIAYAQAIGRQDIEYAQRLYQEAIAYAQAISKSDLEYSQRLFQQVEAYARAIAEQETQYTEQLGRWLQAQLQAQGKDLQAQIKALEQLPCLTYCSELGSLGGNLHSLDFEQLLKLAAEAVSNPTRLGKELADGLAAPLGGISKAVQSAIDFKGCS